MHLDSIKQNIKIVLLSLTLFAVISQLYAQNNYELPSYKDVKVPLEERVNDLLDIQIRNKTK